MNSTATATSPFYDGISERSAPESALAARNDVALSRPYALAIMRDVGAALAHAHSRGVIHGDVNPQNIFITNNGDLRVLDFGASHNLLRIGGPAGNKVSERAPVATPGYASCQLLEGQYPDARDDYSHLPALRTCSCREGTLSRTGTAVEALRSTPAPAAARRASRASRWRVLREGFAGSESGVRPIYSNGLGV